MGAAGRVAVRRIAAVAGDCDAAGVYEQPPGRKRIGPALIVVLVLLAAGAGTGSYYLVKRELADRAAQAGPETGGSTPPPTQTRPQPTPTGPQTLPKVTPKPDDAGTSCPAITADAVAKAGLDGELKLLRYVDATVTGGSGAEAWICKNGAGQLFYQGHRKTGPFDAATSDHTVLLGRGILGKVDTEGDDGFVAFYPKNATDPDDPEHTEYHLSGKAFYFVVVPTNERVNYTITRTVG
jgi:hypothetical protein